MRLPKHCRFPDGVREVRVRKEGRRVILEPIDEWPERILSFLASWKDEIERPPQVPVDQLKDPLDWCSGICWRNPTMAAENVLEKLTQSGFPVDGRNRS